MDKSIFAAAAVRPLVIITVATCSSYRCRRQVFYLAVAGVVETGVGWHDNQLPRLTAPADLLLQTHTIVLAFTATFSPLMKTSLRSASYVSCKRGTARIRPPHAVRRAAIDRYLLRTGPTAANLQQRVCCCGPVLGQTCRRTDRQTDGRPTDA